MIMMTKAAIFVLLSLFSLSDAGVSYIRWGRTVCPTGQIKLYDGYMASSKNSLSGGGANYQCLSDNATFVRGISGHQNPSANIYGVEFDIIPAQAGLFLTDNLSGAGLDHQDIVCARCYIPDSSDVYVLPGRQDCYKSGYDVMYKGFLVSAANPLLLPGNRAEFVCMDEAPEGKAGPVENNQGQVSPVEAACGSLPCPSYQEGTEITCAVCAY